MTSGSLRVLGLVERAIVCQAPARLGLGAMRVIIADDHPLYREAVRLRMERSFSSAEISEVEGLDELLRLAAAAEGKFNLILLDLHMPGMDGAESIRRVVETFAGTPVVLMSGLAGQADVTAAIRAGARGFVPKTMSPELFTTALSMIAAGGSFVPADVIQESSADSKSRSFPLDALTPREQQVLVRLATGAANKEIGRDLGLAEVTVKLHVRQILKKIGARNRAEAASIAAKAGLI
jgi:two-component system, NarL family, nitrate/nitrite response regulator NarL